MEENTVTSERIGRADEPTSGQADVRMVSVKTSGLVAPGSSASASLMRLERDADLVDVTPAMAGIRVMRVIGGTSRIEIDGSDAREALGGAGLHLSADSNVMVMLRNEGDAPAILEAFLALANEGEDHPGVPLASADLRSSAGSAALGDQDVLYGHVVGSMTGTGAVRRAVSSSLERMIGTPDRGEAPLVRREVPRMFETVNLDPAEIVRVRLNDWQTSEVRNLVERGMNVSAAAAASLWGTISSSAAQSERETGGLSLPWAIADALRRALYGIPLSEEARACVRSALDEQRSLTGASEIVVPRKPGQMRNPMSADPPVRLSAGPAGI